MKVLKFLLVALVVLVAVFVGLGFAIPQIDYTVTVDIDRPVDEVWDAFQDPERATVWISGLKSIELVSGEKHAEGSKYRMTFVEEDKTIVVDETIQTVVPNERFVFTTMAEGMGMLADTTFTPNATGTSITSNVTMTGDGVFMRGMLPLMKGMISERQQGDLTALKALVENDA